MQLLGKFNKQIVHLRVRAEFHTELSLGSVIKID